MKFHTSVVAVLVFAIFTFGAIGPLMATPDDSQRLRGLGGRVFDVMVVELPDGIPFHNCYIFGEDGTWIDPPFPGPPGAFVQHTPGASTTYTAEAASVIPDILDILLVQEGEVTPAQGSGVLQLVASTYVTGTFLGDEISVEFLSVGFQNNDCSLMP